MVEAWAVPFIVHHKSEPVWYPVHRRCNSTEGREACHRSLRWRGYRLNVQMHSKVCGVEAERDKLPCEHSAWLDTARRLWLSTAFEAHIWQAWLARDPNPRRDLEPRPQDDGLPGRHGVEQSGWQRIFRGKDRAAGQRSRADSEAEGLRHAPALPRDFSCGPRPRWGLSGGADREASL